MTDEHHAVALADQRQVSMQLDTMDLHGVIGQVSLVHKVMTTVMQQGEHYGTVPGCGDKPTLLKPGAEKLSLTFRLAPRYRIERRDLPDGHREYDVVCELRHIPTDTFVGEGVGCCSTMEGKYRFRQASLKCPKCGAEAIIKGKAEYGGGWVCFAKKGGCGAKWDDGADAIEKQPRGRVDHDNPADFYNTALKMAKKRAHVDAILTATAASDIFTQDIEDLPSAAAPEPSHEPAADPRPKANQRPSTSGSASKASGADDERCKAAYAELAAAFKPLAVAAWKSTGDVTERTKALQLALGWYKDLAAQAGEDGALVSLTRLADQCGDDHRALLDEARGAAEVPF